MSWRWFKSIRLFGGTRLNTSSNGVGWSWGIGIFRYGVSPSGKRWLSVGIPGTGFRYFKYLKQTEGQDSNSSEPSRTGGSESNTQNNSKIKKWDNLR